MHKKRAFTMVELIFVIVILGILAAVAVPKLNASREDAEAAALKANIITAMKDIQNYYTANGELANSYQEMTSVALKSAPRYPGDTSNRVFIFAGDVPCFGFSTLKKNAYSIIAAKGYVDKSKACEKVLSDPEMAPLLDGYYVPESQVRRNLWRDMPSTSYNWTYKVFNRDGIEWE